MISFSSWLVCEDSWVQLYSFKLLNSTCLHVEPLKTYTLFNAQQAVRTTSIYITVLSYSKSDLFPTKIIGNSVLTNNGDRSIRTVIISKSNKNR